MDPTGESHYGKIAAVGGVAAQAVVGLVALGLFTMFVLALSSGVAPPGNGSAPVAGPTPSPVAIPPAAAVLPDQSAVCLSAPASASTSYTPHTVYIVVSEEQAEFVRSGINDSNAVLRDLGLPPVLDEVVVAATPEDAVVVMAAIRAANQVLADQYGVENQVVDLRGQPGG